MWFQSSLPWKLSSLTLVGQFARWLSFSMAGIVLMEEIQLTSWLWIVSLTIYVGSYNVISGIVWYSDCKNFRIHQLPKTNWGWVYGYYNIISFLNVNMNISFPRLPRIVCDRLTHGRPPPTPSKQPDQRLAAVASLASLSTATPGNDRSMQDGNDRETFLGSGLYWYIDLNATLLGDHGGKWFDVSIIFHHLLFEIVHVMQKFVFIFTWKVFFLRFEDHVFQLDGSTATDIYILR